MTLLKWSSVDQVLLPRGNLTRDSQNIHLDGAKIRTIFESSKCVGGKSALVLILVAGCHQAQALGMNPLISLESLRSSWPRNYYP